LWRKLFDLTVGLYGDYFCARFVVRISSSTYPPGEEPTIFHRASLAGADEAEAKVEQKARNLGPKVHRRVETVL